MEGKRLIKTFVWLMVAVLIAAGAWWWKEYGVNLSPIGKERKAVDRVLAKYDFDELRKRGGQASKIEILGKIKAVEDRRKDCRDPKYCLKPEEINFESREIRFESGGKKISGMINLPLSTDSRQKPAVIMIRGYADKPGYFSGSGSWRVADQLAAKGYVTVSLDFLGFAGSEAESTDMLEARFEKVPAVLDLIASVKAMGIVDPKRIGIWAHSNGGQIALSALEVTGERYPTVLWAPMTSPFPQSVLDTASDLDDGGKAVIAAISDFESKYDSRRYAFENYYEWIKAPLLIQQGTNDEWCKVEWQREVVGKIKGYGGEAELLVYPKNDHNLQQDWDKAVARDVEFFRQKL